MIDYSKQAAPEPEPEPQPAPEGDERPDAQIIVLRGENGEMLTEVATPDAKARYRKGAQERKAKWNHRLEGAKTRAGTLPRLLTAPMAAAATNLMLTKIVQEELLPATAKEAAEVAKITHAIYRESSGATAGNLNLTPAERATRMGEIDQLEQALRERAKTATDQLGGAPAEGEDVTPVEVTDVGPDAPAGSDAEWEHESGGV